MLRLPHLGLLGDGIAYLTTKSDTSLHQLPPFLITIMFIVLDLPLLVASLQFVELTDSKVINYICNIKTSEIKLSDIKQWDCYSSATTSQYGVAQSTPFIYISTESFMHNLISQKSEQENINTSKVSHTIID